MSAVRKLAGGLHWLSMQFMGVIQLVIFVLIFSQIVLRWIVQRDLITIPRAKPNHFDENLEVMEFALSADDMAAIDALNINLRSNKDNDPETFPW